jgi:hypothetical protein
MKDLLKKRKAFNFYRSYYDMFMMLSNDKDKLDYITAILEKQFEGNDPNLDGMALLAYTGQKHNIDSQVEGFLNKTRGSIPPSVPPTEGPSHVSNTIVMTTEPPLVPPSVQEKEKEEEKEEEQVKEKDKFLDEDELLELFWSKRK